MRIFIALLLVGGLVAAGCEPAPPKLTKEQFEKKQEQKEGREGHQF
jgi:hypothetical protein